MQKYRCFNFRLRKLNYFNSFPKVLKQNCYTIYNETENPRNPGVIYR